MAIDGEIISIEIERYSVDRINELNNTNYDETNTKEILQFYLDENVDDIDYKVEIIKDYVDEFIESNDKIQGQSYSYIARKRSL